MNRLWAPLLLALLLCVPAFAHAQSNIPIFDPEWQLVPEAHEIDSDCPVGAPLGFGGVLQLIQNVMNASISFGILICVIVIAFAGILWMLTPTNPENHSQAKKILTNAVIGLLIIMSAWLIVDFVMKMLYSGANGQHGKFGPWNEILSGGDVCVTATDPQPLFSGKITAVPGAGIDASGTGRSSGGGSCTVPTNQNNHCSISSLEQTCFASRATDASRICMLESSGGQAAVKSGSDRLNGGTGLSYSVGLWQINLTVHKVAGLDCPSAFTKPCGSEYGTLVGTSKPGACTSSLKPGKEALYQQCVTAAQDPKNSTEVACRLYGAKKPNGGFQPWSYSANKCNVPKW